MGGKNTKTVCQYKFLSIYLILELGIICWLLLAYTIESDPLTLQTSWYHQAIAYCKTTAATRGRHVSLSDLCEGQLWRFPLDLIQYMAINNNPPLRNPGETSLNIRKLTSLALSSITITH